MSKAIEKIKLTVTIKRLSENSLVIENVCVLEKNNDKNKTNLSPPQSVPLTVSLTAEKY